MASEIVGIEHLLGHQGLAVGHQSGVITDLGCIEPAWPSLTIRCIGPIPTHSSLGIGISQEGNRIGEVLIEICVVMDHRENRRAARQDHPQHAEAHLLTRSPLEDANRDPCLQKELGPLRGEASHSSRLANAKGRLCKGCNQARLHQCQQGLGIGKTCNAVKELAGLTLDDPAQEDRPRGPPLKSWAREQTITTMHPWGPDVECHQDVKPQAVAAEGQHNNRRAGGAGPGPGPTGAGWLHHDRPGCC